MKMVPYDYNKIGGIVRRSKTKWEEFIKEFLDSGNVCVEIVDYTNKDAKSCQGSINLYIRRNRMSNTVYALYRSGHVYLVRMDKIED